MTIRHAFRFGDRDHGPYDPDTAFMSGTALDDALAELSGEESVAAEAARTVRRWVQEATGQEWRVRLKRE